MTAHAMGDTCNGEAPLKMPSSAVDAPVPGCMELHPCYSLHLLAPFRSHYVISYSSQTQTASLFTTRSHSSAAITDMDTTQGFTRRLSFGQVALPQGEAMPGAVQTSAEGLQAAAEALQTNNQQRLDAIENLAREQCDAVGEADLRRLKRQFSSLKNTFLHYEVKQTFIAGLSEGLPSGSEEAELAEVEAEVAANVEALRALKGQSEQVQQAIGDLVDRIADIKESFDKHRDVLAANLAQLAQEEAQHAELMAQPLPELPEGLDEEELRAALSAAAAQTREDEYTMAAELALAQELEAAVAREQEELEALKAQLAELEQQSAVEGEKVETDTRLRHTLDRFDAVIELLSTLSGIAVLHASPDLVQLQLTTLCPTEDGACTAQHHTLELHTRPGTREVEQAVLSPPDVDVADVLEVARGEECSMESVVREVQLRLSGWLQCTST